MPTPRRARSCIEAGRRERVIARTNEDRTDFLRKRGFSKSETTKIIETVPKGEGKPP
jgi:hypothetical protein